MAKIPLKIDMPQDLPLHIMLKQFRIEAGLSESDIANYLQIAEEDVMAFE